MSNRSVNIGRRVHLHDPLRPRPLLRFDALQLQGVVDRLDRLPPTRGKTAGPRIHLLGGGQKRWLMKEMRTTDM